MGSSNIVIILVLLSLFFQSFVVFISAQKAKSSWLTLDGSPPLVVARGGFSGLFPSSSSYAYNLAVMTSVPDVILWCDVQLTKDSVGICFPDILMDNSSDIGQLFPKRQSTYVVDGVSMKGWFPVDFTFKELSNVSLTQGIFTRSPDFDGSQFAIQMVDDVFMQNKPPGFWLNVQHDTFYSQHKLSMRNFIIKATKRVIISHISSPNINFLQRLAKPFSSTKTKLIFRFLNTDSIEPSTNQTYGSLLKNLTMIKTFASGILIPKTFIWPVDVTSYLLPHTSLVEDAHKARLQVFASDFANDNTFAYNYSYNPISEYLSFIDNGDFSVDGVVSDFPITPSAARECFVNVDTKTSAPDKPLVISHDGASGDYPGSTDMAYQKAIEDGAEIIDCNVQMSKDGVPFCSSSINLMNSTLVGQTQFRTSLLTAPEIQSTPGVFSFSLNWEDIKGLTPTILNPYPEYKLLRNPKFKSAGKIVSLADFLSMAKNATSLSGVLLRIENAKYLALNQGMNITDAVKDALDKAGYTGPTAGKVKILSSNSSVLEAMKGNKYELIYEIDDPIRGVLTNAIEDIKTFANSVVVNKKSVYPDNGGFLTAETNVVQQFHESKIPVYAQIFRNEFVSQAFDFFSDPVIEINSFVMGADIDGVITDFPKTAAQYKRNKCLKMKEVPMYMSAVVPNQLFQLMNPLSMPPAEAPNPVLEVDDVAESPLPPAVQNSTAQITAETPRSPPNSQPRIMTSSLLLFLGMIVGVMFLF